MSEILQIYRKYDIKRPAEARKSATFGLALNELWV